MNLDINNIQELNSDGGVGTPLHQSSPLVLMVQKVVKSCKAMSSYEAATPLLLEMFDLVLEDAAALAELKRGKEEVRAFFEQRNTPQPSTTYEGCNFFTGDTKADKIVGKSGDIIAKTTTINGGTVGAPGMLTAGYDDQQVSRMLEANVGKTRVINAKWKWAGAYWLLRWVCNYPVDPQKFCEKIGLLELSIPVSLECCYDNIRRYCTLSFMNQDVRKMDEIKVLRLEQDDFTQIREIVIKLSEDLEKAG